MTDSTPATAAQECSEGGRHEPMTDMRTGFRCRWCGSLVELLGDDEGMIGGV